MCDICMYIGRNGWRFWMCTGVTVTVTNSAQTVTQTFPHMSLT